MTVFHSTTCIRCVGTGVMPHPTVEEGRCFRCRGSGREHTRIGYRAYLYAKAIKAKAPAMSVAEAVAKALAFQQVLLDRESVVPAPYGQDAVPAVAGVPEEEAPKPRKRRSKKQPEQAAA